MEEDNGDIGGDIHEKCGTTANQNMAMITSQAKK